MADRHRTNERCAHPAKAKFDVGKLLAKNFSGMSDEAITRSSLRYATQTRQQRQEEERLQSVLQEKSTNVQKRKAAEELSKPGKK